ncbi:stalk domain-containing protein [Calidifontibacillus oryziterrae]|uniref:stalk domain-containing protein n=1 Tax=Calidifontibacillus oryziterrae TaxID=1191699 RepID=UPI0002E29A2E|nr:stalk domain-containing protein [Calidifontibacillus oryziterrae]
MNKKLLSSVVAASIFALPAINTTQAAENYPTADIEMDGVKQNFSQPAVVYNDLTLVPLRGIFEALGVEVEWDEKLQKVTANKGSDVVELKIGEKQAFKNYKPISLGQEPMIMNNSTMVPLRFVSESFGAKVDWDQATRTVKITSPLEASGEKDAESANAKTNDKAGKTSKADNNDNNDNDASSSLPVLTADQAIKKALENSTKLRAADVGMEQLEDKHDNATNGIDFSPTDHGNGPEDAADRSTALGIQKINSGIRKAEKEIEILKETLTYQAKNAYNSVLQAEENLKLAEKELEFAKVQNNIKKQQAAVGLISDIEKITADNTLIESQKQYKAAEDALDKAYDTLNHLLGYSKDKRFNLTDTPKSDEPIEENVDYQVAKVISDSTAIYVAEENLKLAKLGLNLYTFNSGLPQESYTFNELEVDKAELSLSQQKKDIEDGIRQTYHAIKDLENKYEILKTNLANLEQNQKAMKARYDLGMVPLVNLLEVNIGVERIKKQMFDIEAQLELLKMTYEKPWVASPSGM